MRECGRIPYSCTTPTLAAGKWLIDSGASNHYTANRDDLHNFTSIQPIWIMTGKGYIAARGIGHVYLKLTIGIVVVTHVLWVPQLHGLASLLSVPQLTENGFNVIFDRHSCSILYSGQVVATGSRQEKAYYLNVDLDSPTTSVTRVLGHWETTIKVDPTFYDPRHPLHLASPRAMVHGTVDTQPMEVWHRRLGHLNQDAIVKLSTMATGIVIGVAKDQTINQRCSTCLKGSQHRHVSRMVRPPQDKKLGCIARVRYSTALPHLLLFIIFLISHVYYICYILLSMYGHQGNAGTLSHVIFC